MNGAFEGDLIRPLGVVTMNFGIAEYEIDSFVGRLGDAGLAPDSWSQRPIGQKLQLLADSIRQLDDSAHARLDVLMNEARQLLEKRNALIHGCLLAGGRIVSGRRGVAEKSTSVEELNDLAEAIFSWKERLWMLRWRQVEPLLPKQVAVAPPNKSLERTREK